MMGMGTGSTLIDKLIEDAIQNARNEAVKAIVDPYNNSAITEAARKVAAEIAATPEFRAEVLKALLATLTARQERRW